MIKPLLFAALVAAPMAYANEAAETCGKIGNIATIIYDARQGNVPADEMFEAVSESKMGTEMVHEAYTMPRWNTQKRRDENRVDFKSKWVLWCYNTETNEVK